MGARGDVKTHRSGEGQCAHRPLTLSAGGTHLHTQGSLTVFDGGHQPRLCDQDRKAGRRGGTQRSKIYLISLKIIIL